MNRTRKGKLAKRVDNIAKLKHNQKKHYAIMEQVQSERVTDKGLKTSTVTEYFVMGQNITKMSATEGADVLLFRDAEKFANLPNVDDDQVGPLIVPGTYIPSTTVVSPKEMDFILENNKVGGTRETGGAHAYPDFDKSVNPISTSEDNLCPPITTHPLKFSDLPQSLQNPSNRELEGLADANTGEMAEKVAYEVLKEYYGQKKDAA